MTPALAVPQPTLSFDDAGGGAAALEKPITVLIGPVATDGTALTPDGLSVFGLSLRRRRAPGAQLEVWDDSAKSWAADQPGRQAAPITLAYRAGDPSPWQGLVVAAALKDAAGNPALAKATNGYPQYTLAGAFAAKTGAVGTGPQTTPITFAGSSDRNLVVLGAGDGEQLDRATQARLLLAYPLGHVIGGLTVSRNSPGATVRLENAAGAAVVLHADGSIEISPAPGRGVRIAGDVEAERIRYLPAGGGPKRDLD